MQSLCLNCMNRVLVKCVKSQFSVFNFKSNLSWKNQWNCRSLNYCVDAASNLTNTQNNNYVLQNLAEEQQTQILQFIDILLEANQKKNLTAVKSLEEAIDRHVNDSLCLLAPIDSRLGDVNTRLNVIDVGTGPGLPGIILAIARPQWKFVLMDATRKRCTFMEEALEKIGVKNVEVVWSRAEDAGHQMFHREMYDVCVARALAEMRTLVELTLPFLAKGGYLIAAKGANVQEEVNLALHAIQKFGGQLSGIEEVESISPFGARTAVVVQKVTPTPPKYPRRPGLPKLEPL